MRVKFAILVVLSLAITSMVIPMPSHAVEMFPLSNSQAGEYVVFNQNYSSNYFIPYNICMANEAAPNLL